MGWCFFLFYASLLKLQLRCIHGFSVYCLRQTNTSCQNGKRPFCIHTETTYLVVRETPLPASEVDERSEESQSYRPTLEFGSQRSEHAPLIQLTPSQNGCGQKFQLKSTKDTNTVIVC